jgi:hypothetical protein
MGLLKRLMGSFPRVHRMLMAWERPDGSDGQGKEAEVQRNEATGLKTKSTWNQVENQALE